MRMESLHCRQHRLGGSVLHLAVMFVIPTLMILINTVKWQIFLRELGLRPGFIRLFVLYLHIATFFQQLPATMVGGDAARAYALGRIPRMRPR